MPFLAEPDMEIVGEVGSGEEALQAVQELQPEVVIMDVAMPGLNGIEATRQLKKANPNTAVLALTMHEDEQYFFEMLNAGASGYIPKRAAPDDLVSAIRAVSRGHIYLHSTLARFLVKDVLDRPASVSTGAAEELTPREREVLTYIAEGFTNREIAEALVISVKTVDRHRENIIQKLNLHSGIELVKYAIARGLISLE
jgi:DNA-binding NarL/FixJ family response regulator